MPPEDRQRGGDAVEHATEVDVNHRRPAGHVEVSHETDLADAGVADQHVESAELRDCPVHQTPQILGPGDVRGDSDGASAALPDLLGEFVQAVRPARAEDDRRAASGEQACGGLADAAARPSDGDRLPLMPVIGSPLR